jgi:hypothetical protein
MKNQFVTYEIALALKELGFDEECFGYWCYYTENIVIPDQVDAGNRAFGAPLWQQAWSFLFKKLSFYYPALEFQIFSDYSGIWFQSQDNFTGNEGIDIEFDGIEEAILKATELCKNKK